MRLKKDQIHSIVISILHEDVIHVDHITTKEWINIIKNRAIKNNPNTTKIQLGYRTVLAVLNKLVEGDGYYNVTTQSHYVKGDECDSGDGPNHSKYNWFYT